MTVVGFAKTPGGGALAWADSETYNDDAPSGSKTKLVVSPSGVIGIATGYAQLAEHLNEFVIGAGSMAFSEMISRLPALLRARDAAKRIEHLRLGLPFDGLGKCALVGYDYGAARGVIFLEERGFDPTERDAWSSPCVEARPWTAAGALEVAQAQMRILRRRIPGATGLNFTVAKLGAGHQVTKTTVPLSIGDELTLSGAEHASRWTPAHHAAALRDAEVQRRLGY